MSGIVCVYNESGIAQDAPRYLSALRRLIHRGPDGEGSLLRQNLFLGVRSSAIGPGATAEQPLVGADGKVLVALDGHIHNRGELAERLRTKGHPVDASSDVALLLCAYAEYGERCFENLKGVWAIVVWDERLHRLVVSRDRLGVRPLYYFSDGQYFLLASEIKSILALEPSARAVNDERVREFVCNGRIDDWTGTLFARIQPVPPGTVLRIHSDQVASARYWTLRPSTDRRLTPASVLDKLIAAVERHTPPDVAIGLSLSGGIDSSSIAGVLARSSQRETRNLRAFSITPPKTTDESFLIDATIRKTGISHSYVSLDALDYPRLLSQVVDFHDEPIQYSGVFYQFVLRQRMAEVGCRATLVGYGADEIFSGYEYLAVPFLSALVGGGRLVDSVRFVFGARDFLRMSAFRIVANTLRYKYLQARAALVAPIKGAIGEERLRRWRGVPPAGLDVLTPLAAVTETTTSTIPIDYDLEGILRGRAFFKALLQCFRTNIALLVRLEDRNAMANGIELCAPFMDHELVETVLGLPYHKFMEGGRNKAVLRNAATGLLAAEVNGYPRKLPTPGSDAFIAFEVLRPQFLDMLNSASFYSSGLWSRRCEQLYRTDMARGTQPSLWFRVYMLQKWYERVVQTMPGSTTTVENK
jgi:asparagine synthase (glutamine-hydrolysing)